MYKYVNDYQCTCCGRVMTARMYKVLMEYECNPDNDICDCNMIKEIAELRSKAVIKDKIVQALHWFRSADDYQVKGFMKELKLRNSKQK